MRRLVQQTCANADCDKTAHAKNELRCQVGVIVLCTWFCEECWQFVDKDLQYIYVLPAKEYES